MSSYGIYTKIVAQTSQREALVDLLLEVATGMQARADCDLYLVNTAPTEPDAVWVTEVWRSREAHDASLTTEAAQEALRWGRAVIERVGEQIEVEPVGGKGLPADAVGAR